MVERTGGIARVYFTGATDVRKDTTRSDIVSRALIGMILTALAAAFGGANGARDDYDEVVVGRPTV